MKIVSLYNRIWLTEQELENIPIGIEDIKCISILDKTINSAPFNVLLNEKNEFIYTRVLQGSNIDQIDLSYELGKICFFAFCKNILEMPMMILKEIFRPIVEIFKDYRDLQLPFAVSTSVLRVLYAVSQVFRISYYMLPIQLAAIQGFLFNPARGFAKCSLLMEKLVHDHPNQHHLNSCEEKKSINPKELESSIHLWYPEIRLRRSGCLKDEESFATSDFEPILKFSVNEMYKIEAKSIPGIFPLSSYIGYKLVKTSGQVTSNLQNMPGRIYAKLHQLMVAKQKRASSVVHDTSMGVLESK